jgi:hypothetical protein
MEKWVYNQCKFGLMEDANQELRGQLRFRIGGYRKIYAAYAAPYNHTFDKDL